MGGRGGSSGGGGGGVKSVTAGGSTTFLGKAAGGRNVQVFQSGDKYVAKYVASSGEGGSKQARRAFDTKSEAMSFARQTAKTKPAANKSPYTGRMVKGSGVVIRPASRGRAG